MPPFLYHLLLRLRPRRRPRCRTAPFRTSTIPTMTKSGKITTTKRTDMIKLISRIPLFHLTTILSEYLSNKTDFSQKLTTARSAIKLLRNTTRLNPNTTVALRQYHSKLTTHHSPLEVPPHSLPTPFFHPHPSPFPLSPTLPQSFGLHKTIIVNRNRS